MKLHYRTGEFERLQAKARRDALRQDGLCINGRRHGPATAGVLCAKCRETHRGPTKNQTQEPLTQ